MNPEPEGVVDLTSDVEAVVPPGDVLLEVPQLVRLKRIALANPNGQLHYSSTEDALVLARQSVVVQDLYATGSMEDTFTFQIASSEFISIVEILKAARANPKIITEEWVLSPPLAEGTLPFLEAYSVQKTIIDAVLSRSVALKLESCLGVEDTVVSLTLLSCKFPRALGMTRTNAMEIMRSRLDTSIPRLSKRLLLTPHQVLQLAPLFQKELLPLPPGFIPDDVPMDVFPHNYCNKMSLEYMTDTLKCFRLINGLEGLDTTRAVFQRSGSNHENVFICAIPWTWKNIPYELRVARDREGCWQLSALEDRQQLIMEEEDEGAVQSYLEEMEVLPLKKIVLFSAPGTSFLPHPPSDYWVPEKNSGVDMSSPLQFGEYNSGLHVCFHPPLGY